MSQTNSIRVLRRYLRNEAVVALRNHRLIAKDEYEWYLNTQRSCKTASSDRLRLVFDFAEKVLLLSMERQTGILHFINGLKYDIFGISNSNISLNFNLVLPEGHWPGKRDQMK